MGKIWVVVINRNWLEDTIECLDSLEDNNYRDNLEVVLIDNWSSNNEAEVLMKKYKWTVNIISKDTNEWFTWWVNAWIEYLHQTWVSYYLLLNNDTVIYDWLFQGLLKPMIDDDSIWITWPLIKYYKKNIIWSNWWSINYLLWLFQSLDKWKKVSLKSKDINSKIEYISWCCMLIRKKVVVELWCLDNDYFAYWEDADYCIKAVKEWRKLYQNDAVIIEHKVSSSTTSKGVSWIWAFKAYLCARNSILFAKKNLHWFQFLLFVSSQFTFVFVYKLLFQIRSYTSFVAYIRWIFWLSYSKT